MTAPRGGGHSAGAAGFTAGPSPSRCGSRRLILHRPGDISSIRIQATEGGIRIPVRARPRASRSELAGPYGGALKVRLAAPPVEGAANRELEKVLAKALGVPRSDVSVVAGETGRNKVVEVRGLGIAAARRALGL